MVTTVDPDGSSIAVLNTPEPCSLDANGYPIDDGCQAKELIDSESTSKAPTSISGNENVAGDRQSPFLSKITQQLCE